MIRHLQMRVVYLEGRVAQLESGRNPAYISQPSLYPRNRCSKCGMILENVMGYVCADISCPTFPQVTCGTGTAGQTTWSASVNAPQVDMKKYQPRSGDYDSEGKWYPDRSR